MTHGANTIAEPPHVLRAATIPERRSVWPYSRGGVGNTAKQRTRCAASGLPLEGRANRHTQEAKEPAPEWEGKRDRWLGIVDQKARAHAAALLQERTFWEQAPSNFEEADNPSALLQSIVSQWLRWVGAPVQGRAAS